MNRNADKSLAVKTLEEKLLHLYDELDILNATADVEEDNRNIILNNITHIEYYIDILESIEKLSMAGQFIFWDAENKKQNNGGM